MFKKTMLLSVLAALVSSTVIAQAPFTDAAKDPLYRSKDDKQREYFFAAAGEKIPYRVYVPSSWDANKKLPMLVVLHGGGLTHDAPFDRAPEDLKGILVKEAEKRAYVVVAPEGYKGNYGANFQLPGATLGGADANAAPPKNAAPAIAPLSPEQVARNNALSEEDVMNVVERTAAEYNVDRTRIYLMGNSRGEVGTLHLSQKYPGKWCAIGPSDGPVEPAGFPYEKIKYLSGAIFVHGDLDKLASIDANRALADGFRKQGVDVKFIEVKGGQHGTAWYMALSEMFDFYETHRCTR